MIEISIKIIIIFFNFKWLSTTVAYFYLYTYLPKINYETNLLLAIEHFCLPSKTDNFFPSI